MAGGSRLDHVYRSILMTKFFRKGWGKPENLKRLFAFRKVVSNRESCFKLVSPEYPITITKEDEYSDCKILEGQFLSPFVTHLPGLLPKEAEMAYFQLVLPKKWSSDHYKPICLHLAGTGDHGFWRRRQLMAKPLLKEGGIGSILLENPFYGLRKPKDQVRSSLHNVSDIFVMGGCLILESLALFHWCERAGLGPLGITGLSMGGHMASLAATNWPKPLVLVPCLSWSTASLVFTKGVMSGSINWQLLENQYFSDGIFKDEIKKMVQIVEDAFWAGQEFAKNYPQSMERINELELGGGSDRATRKLKGLDLVRPGSVENLGLGTEPNRGMAVYNAVGAESGTPLPPPENGGIGPGGKESDLFPIAAPIADKLTGNLVSQFNESTFRLLGITKKDPAPSTELLKDVNNNKNLSVVNGQYESLQFMRGIMDECTHLANFDLPVDTSLIIAVCARDDAYVPREGCMALTDIWPGAEVRYLNAGHVSAYLLYQNTFRKAILECFKRQQRKYGYETTQ